MLTGLDKTITKLLRSPELKSLYKRVRERPSRWKRRPGLACPASRRSAGPGTALGPARWRPGPRRLRSAPPAERQALAGPVHTRALSPLGSFATPTKSLALWPPLPLLKKAPGDPEDEVASLGQEPVAWAWAWSALRQRPALNEGAGLKTKVEAVARKRRLREEVTSLPSGLQYPAPHHGQTRRWGNRPDKGNDISPLGLQRGA